MNNCKFSRAWIGPCKEDTNGEYCEEHTKLKCSSCGAQATRDCAETMQFVCGAPLCDDCEHTIRENGCNSGAPLPQDYKAHCKKDKQIYKSWIERGDDELDIFVNPKGDLERGDEFTATIQKIKFIGKWVEFWFVENYSRILNDTESYHQSSKIYKLEDAVHNGGILDEILNDGYKGRRITWERLGMNYEIKSIE